jgi:hypothetical protein
MSIPFTLFSQINNRYCVAYFGHNKEYLIQLSILRPVIEKTLPGIDLHLGCLDQYRYLLDGQERILPLSDLPSKRASFVCIRELKCDLATHPVLQLITESKINLPDMAPPRKKAPETFVILPVGIEPTKSLNESQINLIRSEWKYRDQKLGGCWFCSGSGKP